MNTAGIGSTTLVVNKAAITAGTITEDEYTAMMDAFKSYPSRLTPLIPTPLPFPPSRTSQTLRTFLT